MIYRIVIKDGRLKPVEVYAHPAWPFVMGGNGDPTDDYLVLFQPGPVLSRIEPKVFACTKIKGRGGVIPGTYHRELTDFAVVAIDDLRKLG